LVLGRARLIEPWEMRDSEDFPDSFMGSTVAKWEEYGGIA